MKIKVRYSRDAKKGEETVTHTGIWVDTQIVPIRKGKDDEWRDGYVCCIIINANDGQVDATWPEHVRVVNPELLELDASDLD